MALHMSRPLALVIREEEVQRRGQPWPRVCMCLAPVRRPEELCGLGFANLWPEVAKKA
jgi:hypothetical protein